MFNKTEDKFCPLCDGELVNDAFHNLNVGKCCLVPSTYPKDTLNRLLKYHFYTGYGFDIISFENSLWHINYKMCEIYDFYHQDFYMKIDPSLSRKENILKFIEKYRMYKVFS